MTLKTTFNAAFVTVDKVAVLRERATKRRWRSVWLGVSQLALNLPRILITGLCIAGFQIILSIFKSIGVILVSVIMTPLLAVLVSLFLGLAGRLEDEDSEAAKTQETNKLLIMMDIRQVRKDAAEKGSSSAD